MLAQATKIESAKWGILSRVMRRSEPECRDSVGTSVGVLCVITEMNTGISKVSDNMSIGNYKEGKFQIFTSIRETGP